MCMRYERPSQTGDNRFPAHALARYSEHAGYATVQACTQAHNCRGARRLNAVENTRQTLCLCRLVQSAELALDISAGDAVQYSAAQRSARSI
jgi:hypothetical protein